MFNLTYQPNGKISAVDNTLPVISIQEATFDMYQLKGQLFMETGGDTGNRPNKMIEIIKKLIIKVKQFFAALKLKFNKTLNEHEKRVLAHRGTILKYAPTGMELNVPPNLAKPKVKFALAMFSKVTADANMLNDGKYYDAMLKKLFPQYSGPHTTTELFNYVYGETVKTPDSNIPFRDIVDAFLNDVKLLQDIDKWMNVALEKLDRAMQVASASSSAGNDPKELRQLISFINDGVLPVAQLCMMLIGRAQNARYHVLNAVINKSMVDKLDN